MKNTRRVARNLETASRADEIRDGGLIIAKPQLNIPTEQENLSTLNEETGLSEPPKNKELYVTPSIDNVINRTNEVLEARAQSFGTKMLYEVPRALTQLGTGLFLRAPGILAEGTNYATRALFDKEFGLKDVDFRNSLTDYADYLNQSVNKEFDIKDENPDNIWDATSILDGVTQTGESIAEFYAIGGVIGKGASWAAKGINTATKTAELTAKTAKNAMMVGEVLGQNTMNARVLYNAAKAGQLTGRTAEYLASLTPAVGTAGFEAFINAKEGTDRVLANYDTKWQETANKSAEDLISKIPDYNPDIHGTKEQLAEVEYNHLKESEGVVAKEAAGRAGLFTFFTSTAIIGWANHAGSKAFMRSYNPASASAIGLGENTIFSRALAKVGLTDDILAGMPAGMNPRVYLSKVLTGQIVDKTAQTAMKKFVKATTWESFKEGLEEMTGQYLIDEGVYESEMYTQLLKKDAKATYFNSLYDNMTQIPTLARAWDSFTNEESIQQGLLGALGGGVTNVGAMVSGEMSNKKGFIGDQVRKWMPGVMSVEKENALRKQFIDDYLETNNNLTQFAEQLAYSNVSGVNSLEANQFNEAGLADWFTGVFSRGNAGQLNEQIETMIADKGKAYQESMMGATEDEKKELTKEHQRQTEAMNTIKDRAKLSEILYNSMSNKLSNKSVVVPAYDKDGNEIAGQTVNMPLMAGFSHYLAQTLALQTNNELLQGLNEVRASDKAENLTTVRDVIADLIKSDNTSFTNTLASNLTDLTNLANSRQSKDYAALLDAFVKKTGVDKTKLLNHIEEFSNRQTLDNKELNGVLSLYNAISQRTEAKTKSYSKLFGEDDLVGSMEEIVKTLDEARKDSSKIFKLFSDEKYRSAFGGTNIKQLLNRQVKHEKIKKGVYDFSDEQSIVYDEEGRANPTPSDKVTLKQAVINYRTDKEGRDKAEATNKPNADAIVPPSDEGKGEVSEKKKGQQEQTISALTEHFDNLEKSLGELYELSEQDDNRPETKASIINLEGVKADLTKYINNNGIEALVDNYNKGEKLETTLIDNLVDALDSYQSVASFSFSETEVEALEDAGELSSIVFEDIALDDEIRRTLAIKKMANNPFIVGYSAVHHTGLGDLAQSINDSKGRIDQKSETESSLLNYININSNEIKLEAGQEIHFKVDVEFLNNLPQNFIDLEGGIDLSNKDEAINMLPIAIYVYEKGKPKKIGFVRQSGYDRGGSLRALTYIDSRFVNPKILDANLRTFRESVYDMMIDKNGQFDISRSPVFSSKVESKTEGSLEFNKDVNDNPVFLPLSKAIHMPDIKSGRVEVSIIKSYVVTRTDDKVATTVTFESSNGKTRTKTINADWSIKKDIYGRQADYGVQFVGKGVLLVPTATGLVEDNNFHFVYLRNSKVSELTSKSNRKQQNKAIINEIIDDMYNMYTVALMGHTASLNAYGAVSLPSYEKNYIRDFYNKYRGILQVSESEFVDKMQQMMSIKGSVAFRYSHVADFIKNFIYIDAKQAKGSRTDVERGTINSAFSIETSNITGQDRTDTTSYGKVTVRDKDNNTEEFWADVKANLNKVEGDNQPDNNVVFYIRTVTNGVEDVTTYTKEQYQEWVKVSKAIFNKGVDNSYFRVRKEMLGTTLQFKAASTEGTKFEKITYEELLDKLELVKSNLKHSTTKRSTEESKKTKGDKGIYSFQPSIHFGSQLTLDSKKSRNLGRLAKPKKVEDATDYTEEMFGIPQVDENGDLVNVTPVAQEISQEDVTETEDDLEYDEDNYNIDDMGFGDDLSSIELGGETVDDTFNPDAIDNLEASVLQITDLREVFSIPRVYDISESGEITNIKSFFNYEQTKAILDNLAYIYFKGKASWMKEFKESNKSKKELSDFLHAKIQGTFEAKKRILDTLAIKKPSIKEEADYLYVAAMTNYTKGAANVKQAFINHLRHKYATDLSKEDLAKEIMDEEIKEALYEASLDGAVLENRTIDEVKELYINSSFQDDWTFRIDGFKTMSANLKSKLFFIPEYVLEDVPYTLLGNGGIRINYKLTEGRLNKDGVLVGKGEKIAKKTVIGTTSFVDSRQLYQKLQEVLYDVASVNDIADTLKKYIDRGVTKLTPIYEGFANSPENGGYSHQVRNEFFSVFSKSNLEFYLTIVSQNEDGNFNYKLSQVNRDTADSLIVTRWASNLKDSEFVDKDGNYLTDKIIAYRNDLLAYKKSLNKDLEERGKSRQFTGSIFTNFGFKEVDVFNEKRNELVKLFNRLGFDYTTADFDFMLSVFNEANKSEDTRKTYSIEKGYRDVSYLIDDLLFLSNQLLSNSDKTVSEYNLFVDTERKTIKKYSTIKLETEPQLHVASFRANGKGYYSFSLNSLFTRRIQLMKRDSNESLEILRSAYGSTSMYPFLMYLHSKGYEQFTDIKEIFEMIDQIAVNTDHADDLKRYFRSFKNLFNKVPLAELVTEFGENFNAVIINSIKNEDTDVTKEFKETTDREIELQMIYQIFKGLTSKFGSIYHSNNFGDKSVRYGLKVPLMSEIVDENGNFNDDSLEVMLSIVTAEMTRMEVIKDQAKTLELKDMLLNIHYVKEDLQKGKLVVDGQDNRAISRDALGYKFINFDFLNLPQYKLFDSRGDVVTELTNIDNLPLKELERETLKEYKGKEQVNEYIKMLLQQHLTDRVNDKISEWVNLGIAETLATTKSIEFTKLADESTTKTLISKSLRTEARLNTVRYAAMIYEYNQHYNNAAFTQIYGDPLGGAVVKRTANKEVDMFMSMKKTGENNSKRNSGVGAPSQRGIYTTEKYYQAIINDYSVDLSEYDYALMKEVYVSLMRNAMTNKAFSKLTDKQLEKGLQAILKDQSLDIINKDVTKALNEIKLNVKTYQKMDITDGSELVTLNEKINELNAYGADQITDKQRARLKEIYSNRELYNTIMNDKGRVYAEDYALANRVYSPTKPVYYGNRSIPSSTGFSLNVNEYFKTSSIVLLPIFTKGLEIDKIRRAMENGVRPIHRLTYPSGRKKVGSSSTTVHNKQDNELFKGLSDEQIDNYFSAEGNATVIELDRKYLGIQVDTDDNMKHKTIQGTQESSLINLDHEDYYVDSEFEHNGETYQVPYMYKLDILEGLEFNKAKSVYLSFFSETGVSEAAILKAGYITSKQFKRLYHDTMNKIIDEKEKKLDKRLNIVNHLGKQKLKNIERLKSLLMEEVDRRDLGSYVTDSLETQLKNQLESLNKEMAKHLTNGVSVVFDKIANEGEGLSVIPKTKQEFYEAVKTVAKAAKTNEKLYAFAKEYQNRIEESIELKSGDRVIRAERVWSEEDLTANVTKFFNEFKEKVDNPFQSYYSKAREQLLRENDFIIPLYLNNNIKRFESIMLSAIESEIIDLKMPGSQLVLTSEFGITNSDNFTNNEEADKPQILDLDDIADQSEITWIGKKMDNLKVNQILMPSFFKNFDLNSITKVVKGVRTIDESKIDKKLLSLYGFRIPTQGYNNLGSLEVVGFLPPQMGAVIIANKVQLGKMGFDFDYDKLFVYWYNYEIVDNKAKITTEEYAKIKDRANELAKEANDAYEVSIDENENQITTYENYSTYFKEALSEFNANNNKAQEDGKTVIRVIGKTGNTKAKTLEELQNLSLDLRHMKLNHPSVVGKTYLTNGYGNFREYADEIEVAMSKNRTSYNYLSSTTQKELYINARFGKVAVGYWANSLMYLLKSQDAQLFMDKKHGVLVIDSEGKLMQDKANRNDGKSGSPIGLNRLDKIYGEFGEKISTTIQNVMSLVVDDAKTPTAIRLNFNFNTFGVINLMIGVGVTDEKFLSYFVNQEAIRNFSKELTNISDTFSEPEENKKLIAANKVLEDLAKKAGVEFKALTNSKLIPEAFNKEDLVSVFNRNVGDNAKYRFADSVGVYNLEEGSIEREAMSYYDYQYNVMKTFLYYDNYNSTVRKKLKITNTNTVGLGAFFSSLYTTIANRDSLVDKNIGNSNQLMKDDFYQHMYKKAHLKAASIYSSNQYEKVIHPIFTKAFEEIVKELQETLGKTLDEDDIRVLSDDFIHYIKTMNVAKLVNKDSVEDALHTLLIDPRTNIAEQYKYIKELVPSLKVDNIFFKLLNTSSKGFNLIRENKATNQKEIYTGVSELSINNIVKYYSNDDITKAFLDLLLIEASDKIDPRAVQLIRAFARNLVATSLLSGQNEYTSNGWSKFIPSVVLKALKFGEFSNALDFSSKLDFINFINQFYENNPKYIKNLKSDELLDFGVSTAIEITKNQVVVNQTLAKTKENMITLEKLVENTYLSHEGVLYKKTSTDGYKDYYVRIEKRVVSSTDKKIRYKLYDFGENSQFSDIEIQALNKFRKLSINTVINKTEVSLDFNIIPYSKASLDRVNNSIYSNPVALRYKDKIVIDKEAVIRLWEAHKKGDKYITTVMKEGAASYDNPLTKGINNIVDFYKFHAIKAALINTTDIGKLTNAQYDARINTMAYSILYNDNSIENAIRKTTEVTLQSKVVSSNELANKLRKTAADFKAKQGKARMYDENGKRLISATSISKLLNKEEVTQDFAASNAFGNKIDKFAEDIVKSITKSIQQLGTINKDFIKQDLADLHKGTAQEESFKRLADSLVNFYVDEIINKYKVKEILTQAMVKDTNPIMGILDLLFITDTGYIIADVKTMSFSSYNSYSRYYKDKHTAQLSLYNGILMNAYGGQAIKTIIIPIEHYGLTDVASAETVDFEFIPQHVVEHDYNRNDYETAVALSQLNAGNENANVTTNGISLEGVEASKRKGKYFVKDSKMANAASYAIAFTGETTQGYTSSTKTYRDEIFRSQREKLNVGNTEGKPVWVFGHLSSDNKGLGGRSDISNRLLFKEDYLPLINKAIINGTRVFYVGEAAGIDTMTREYLTKLGFKVSETEANRLDYGEKEQTKQEDKVQLSLFDSNVDTNINQVKVISEDYGVVKVDTSPSKEQTEQFVELIRKQAEKQTYKENVGKYANEMFHYGLMWSRVRAASKPTSIESYDNKKASISKLIANNQNAKGNTLGISEYTYSYHELDQNGNQLPSIKELQPIIDVIEQSLGIDMSNYDSVIANIYLDNEFIYPHKDVTESKTAVNYPVVVYTLGNDAGLGIVDNNKGKMTFVNKYDATYLKGQELASGYTSEVQTKNGTIYTFGLGGKGRFQLTHSTPIQNKKLVDYPAISLPNGKVITKYTITLTFRRAQDLETDMDISPRGLNTNKESKEQTISIESEIVQADKLPAIEQNFKDGSNYKDEQGNWQQRRMTEDNKGKTSMELILEGKRTRTTRSKSQMRKFMEDYKVNKLFKLEGKVLKMNDKEGNTAYVRITKVAPFTQEYQDETWQKEGWKKSVTDRHVGQYPYAIEFELVSGIAMSNEGFSVDNANANAVRVSEKENSVTVDDVEKLSIVKELTDNGNFLIDTYNEKFSNNLTADQLADKLMEDYKEASKFDLTVDEFMNGVSNDLLC